MKSLALRLLPPVSALFLLLPGSLAAAPKVTLYLDGGIVEREVRAIAGVAEIRLSPSVAPLSVRIAPRGGATIIAVERLQLKPSKKQEQSIAQLEERRKQVQDRQRALAAREEIFRRAAQSQSGKAPRKSKTNPEPLATIRQGTEYAISQLEAVLRLSRRAQEELAAVESRLAAEKEEAQLGGMLLKVRTDRRDTSLDLRYLQKDLSWAPRGDLRASRDGGQLILKGRFPPLSPDTSLWVVPATVGAGGAVSPLRASTSPLAVFTLAELRREELPGLLAAYRYRFSNPLPTALLPLPVSCYQDGEYLGSATVPTPAAAGEVEVLCGR